MTIAPRPPFSATTRRGNWDDVDSRRFDLIVIGGGITGCGIALDAATRGLRVVLLEAGDIGSGTSGRSSRLVHGGLRYLETLEFRLVFEASAERRRLLRSAPHLVRPLPFLFPIWRGDRVGTFRLRAGLWLYDALALGRNIAPHRILDRRQALHREGELRSDGLLAAGLYHDAAVDDARLTLAVARSAHAAGAVALPRTRVTGFLYTDSRLTGVDARDETTGASKLVHGTVVVNASGPWTDELRQLADPSALRRLRPTKGVHLVVRRERLGNRGALIFPSPVDGRVMFILPSGGGLTYIGTTDTEFAESPGDATADRADIDYLIASANGVFPRARLNVRDVISTWAGVRPLLGPNAPGASAGSISREHAIWSDRSGLLNVAGGKLTTYRVMASDTVDEAVKLLHAREGRSSGRSRTARLRLADAPTDMPGLTAHVEADARDLRLPTGSAAHLVSAYGTAALVLLKLAREQPELRLPLLDGLPYLRAEVVHAVRNEMAITVSDVLRRRTHLFYEAVDGGLEVAPQVAALMAAEDGLPWDETEIRNQLDLYRDEVIRSRRPLQPD